MPAWSQISFFFIPFCSRTSCSASKAVLRTLRLVVQNLKSFSTWMGVLERGIVDTQLYIEIVEEYIGITYLDHLLLSNLLGLSLLEACSISRLENVLLERSAVNRQDNTPSNLALFARVSARNASTIPLNSSKLGALFSIPNFAPEILTIPFNIGIPSRNATMPASIAASSSGDAESAGSCLFQKTNWLPLFVPFVALNSIFLSSPISLRSLSATVLLT